MNNELLAELKQLAPWTVKMDLGNGLTTTDGNAPGTTVTVDGRMICVDPHQHVGQLFRELFPDGMQGRSILDIGCNAGSYSFVAREYGAGRVLGVDVRELWINQANFLRRNLLINTEDMEFKLQHAKDIPEGDQFDLVLFMGIFYHLPDPIHELRRACDRAKELIVVDTAYDPTTSANTLRMKIEGIDTPLSGVDGLSWHPGGSEVIEGILEFSGFAHSRVHYKLEKGITGKGPFGRMRVIGAREESALKLFDRDRAAAGGVVPVI